MIRKYLVIGVLWSAALLGVPRASGATPLSEYELLRKVTTPQMAGLITNRTLPDSRGFVGFHQRDGTWYEAGMQRGGCWTFIGAVVAGDSARAEVAWKSVDTTFAHQAEDGGFESVRKPDDTHDPTLPERVETAFFYLQELGHAILVVQASPMEPQFRDRIAALKPKMRRACAFIQAGYDGIIVKAGHTANRMFIAAKAFGLCGVILKDDQLKESARKLVAVAMAKRDADGIFVEKGGRDSSYNAVSLLMAQVLSIYLPDPELDAAMVKAMAWQRTRVRPTGEVDITGNTRTGFGQEQMMGNVKTVNYSEVALAFLYFGLLRQDAEALQLAERVAGYRP
jgi:hypothetical protein